MREYSGKICETPLEVLLCLFYKYPCCDLFCGHVEEILVGRCGHEEILVCIEEELGGFESCVKRIVNRERGVPRPGNHMMSRVLNTRM